MKYPELREWYWDQIHPRTKKLRSKHYENSLPWTTVSESYLSEPSESEPKYKYWIDGTYTVEVPLPERLNEDRSSVKVLLTMMLNFAPAPAIKTVSWIIDTLQAESHTKVAYPGVHQGAIDETTQANFYELIWYTPIFSPYVGLEVGMRWEDYKTKLEPITGRSRNKQYGTFIEIITEEVGLSDGDTTVLVLQEVLKDVARLLVYGPRYSDMAEGVRLSWK